MKDAYARAGVDIDAKNVSNKLIGRIVGWIRIIRHGRRENFADGCAPFQDFVDPSLAERFHSLLDCHLFELIAGQAGDDCVAEGVIHR